MVQMGRMSLGDLPLRVLRSNVVLPSSSSSNTGGLLSSGPLILRRSKEVAITKSEVVADSADLQ